MARLTLDPTAVTATFLLKLPRPDLDRLRAMVDAFGAKTLSALMRDYLDESLARDARRLARYGGRGRARLLHGHRGMKYVHRRTSTLQWIEGSCL
jgi:hypothetical protein